MALSQVTNTYCTHVDRVIAMTPWRLKQVVGDKVNNVCEESYPRGLLRKTISREAGEGGQKGDVYDGKHSKGGKRIPVTPIQRIYAVGDITGSTATKAKATNSATTLTTARPILFTTSYACSFWPLATTGNRKTLGLFSRRMEKVRELSRSHAIAFTLTSQQCRRPGPRR